MTYTATYKCADGKRCAVKTQAESGLEKLTENELLKLKGKTLRCPGCEYITDINKELFKYSGNS